MRPRDGRKVRATNSGVYLASIRRTRSADLLRYPRSVLELYLVRHGATSWNESGYCQGRKDVPLSEGGRTQAALLRDASAARPRALGTDTSTLPFRDAHGRQGRNRLRSGVCGGCAKESLAWRAEHGDISCRGAAIKT